MVVSIRTGPGRVLVARQPGHRGDSPGFSARAIQKSKRKRQKAISPAAFRPSLPVVLPFDFSLSTCPGSSAPGGSLPIYPERRYRSAGGFATGETEEITARRAALRVQEKTPARGRGSIQEGSKVCSPIRCARQPPGYTRFCLAWDPHPTARHAPRPPGRRASPRRSTAAPPPTRRRAASPAARGAARGPS
jgi:hypothetical protein